MQEDEIDFGAIVRSLTDEQREIYKQITGHDGRTLYETGVDVAALRKNLKLTPTERLRKMERELAFLLEVRHAGLSRDGAGGKSA